MPPARQALYQIIVSEMTTRAESLSRRDVR